MRERSSLERELQDLGLRTGMPGAEQESVIERLWRKGKQTIEDTATALKVLAAGKQVLMKTKGGREVVAHIFPGTSDRRALIIGGVHGSELSGIEVVERLLPLLRGGSKPHFTVVVIPRLFPDNAAEAEKSPRQIGSEANIGRKTKGNKVDPNRHFPMLGKPFDPAKPVDAGPQLSSGRRGAGRAIEPENVALLKLIDTFRPERIASVHAHRTCSQAGIYADPRTDAAGIALGFAPDEQLALAMARMAASRGAKVPGNRLDEPQPNAVYPLDPDVVPTGQRQPRETKDGISLGGWGSTEVVDTAHPTRNRPAMTVITVEVQTAHRIQDQASQAAKETRRREFDAIAVALRDVFLRP
jgi:hypothetical protein